MKTVIAGQGKSGTTALFYKLLAAFDSPPRTLVECTRYDPEGDDRQVLAKVLIDPPGKVDFDSFRHFDRKVLIVRDPRDNLISRLLYRPYNQAPFVSNPDAVYEFIGLLTQKEQDPASVSLRRLIRCFDRHTGVDSLPRLKQHPTTGLEFAGAHPEYFSFHYEDLVDARLDDLAGYLGMPLTTAATPVAKERQRVVRAARYGQWRDWFTPEDIDCFAPAFGEYLQYYHYAEDWELSQARSLDPAVGSAYVLRIVNERRDRLGLPPLAA